VLFGDSEKKWKLGGPLRGTAEDLHFPGVSEGCFLKTLGRRGNLVDLLGTAENTFLPGFLRGAFLDFSGDLGIPPLKHSLN
jgi:hypothetical protein